MICTCILPSSLWAVYTFLACSAVYVLLSLNIASILYCFEDTDEHKGKTQEADYREASYVLILWNIVTSVAAQGLALR